MGRDTKKRVLDYLEKISGEIDFENPERCTAASVADEMEMSRTVVSQYLNEAVAEGLVVKVNSRPVYFFAGRILAELPGRGEEIRREGGSGSGEEDRSSMAGRYVFASLAELKEELGSGGKKDVFADLVGSRGSLSYNVEQCKAAITYPKTGLPILLLGETGTGKSYLARLMFEYAQEKKIIGAEGQFVSVNCAEYADNEELFLTNLFGYRKGAYTGADKDRRGLISLADGGLLFLDEVHCLTSQCQEKLFHFMDKGQYHMVGDNEKWYTASTRIVMATTENPEVALLKTLMRRIPLVTSLPSLEERPVYEKKEILCFLLQKEKERVERRIRIVSAAYQSVLKYEFKGNVGELVNCVRTCVANAWLDAQSQPDKDMVIQVYHLPDYILKSRVVRTADLEETRVLEMEDLQRELRVEKKVYALNRDLIFQYEKILKDEADEDLITVSQNRFLQYLDDLSMDNASEDNPKASLYMEIVRRACMAVGKRRGITFSNQDILNVGRFICDYLQNGSSCDRLQRKHPDIILRAQDIFNRKDAGQDRFMAELCGEISGSLGKNLDPLGVLDLSIAVSTFTTHMEKQQTMGVVLAHGYSTASSMAATADHILGSHVFEGIDMPVDVSSETVARKLSAYIRQMYGVKDIILMVDLGSLMEIYKKIDVLDNINLGLVGDVSMRMMLQIGEDILRGVPIKNILDNIKGYRSEPECFFLENRKKSLAVLTVCATGMGTAERIADLLGQSLPDGAGIQTIPYNYKSLSEYGKKSPVFEKYNVLSIVGTHDPGIGNIPYISLEDIVQQHNTEEFTRMLSNILDKEEVKQFNDNLVRNFSLTNLVSYLTILNPEKVIGFAEEIIRQLQVRTGVAFQNRIKAGLYVHICCMIERLLTDREGVNYEGVLEFVQEQREFITIVRECFKKVEEYYGIVVPASEAAYLYEYIYKM